MIIVDLIGRLGNQLFQYAFAIKVKKELKTLLILNPIQDIEINKYFELDFFTRFSFYKIGNIFRIFLLWKAKNFRVIKQSGYENNILIKNSIHYSGFFQSELFFNNYIDDINKRFTIKKKYCNKFNKKYKDLFFKNKVIVMHIRRTDYVNYGTEELGGSNMCLPMSFYEDCLTQIANIYEYKIICVSDDIKYCIEYFKGRNFIFESNEMIIDFQLIKNADIAIIANSSFSWWAAYLNDRPNKIVYAPKYWTGFKVNKEYPLGIIPNNFIPISVN